MTTFNRRAILTTAWARYRHWHHVWESIHGPTPFNRAEFAFKLQIAWAEAKRESMTAENRRRDAIEREMAFLPYKSARINIEPRRQQLQAALIALAV